MAETDLTALVTAVALETDMVDTTHQVTGDVQTGVIGIADAAMVKECLRVLCDNALKYTPEGGSVDISLKAENGWAKIAVTDTGMGIPEEDLAHILTGFSARSSPVPVPPAAPDWGWPSRRGSPPATPGASTSPAAWDWAAALR